MMPRPSRVAFWLSATVFAAFVHSAPRLAAAETPIERDVKAIDAPRMGGRVELNGPIAVGAGRIEPGPGTAVRQLLCGDKPCGLYVAGPAVFVFELKDPFSLPVGEHNLSEAAPKLPSTKTEQSLTVREQLREAVLWQHGLNLTAAAETSTPGLPSWLTEILEHPFFRRPGVTLLAAAGGGSPQAAVAYLRGEHENLRWSYDPYYVGFESVHLVKRDSRYTGVDRDRYFGVELLRQPINRQWWQRFPDPLVVVKRQLELDHPEGETLNVRSRVELKASRDGITVWDATLTEQVYEGNRRFPVEVRAVKVGGQDADWIHRDGTVLVRWNEPLKAGDKVVVDIEYGGRLALQYGGDQLWVHNDFPSSSLAGEMGTLEMKVRTKAPFVPFAAGKVISRESKDGYNTVSTRVDTPAQFAFAAAGKYEMVSDTRAGTTVHVASYSFARKDGAKRLLNNFFAAKEFYEKLFDVPYPFDELTILEIPSWGWGQAPPGLILLTQEAYAGGGSDIMSRIYSGQLNRRFLHEVAHGWWGHVSRMDSAEEQWITESFAEYTSGLAVQAMYGGTKGEKAFEDALDGWSGMGKSTGKAGSVYLANYLSFEEWTDDRIRTLLLYSKGAAVIHAIRERLQKELGSVEAGDRAFIAFLRAILKSFPDSWAYTQFYPQILQQITKTDWNPFFAQYVYGTETPEVSLGKGSKGK